MNTTNLYRPVGEKEMIKILDSGSRCFPPRLDFQPIFYPVLNRQYAIDIASQWNTGDSFGNYLGFVTQFCVEADFLSKYEIQNVGAPHHEEYWIPAEELDDLNKSIVGTIDILDIFIGENFLHSEDSRIETLVKNMPQ